MSDAYEVVAESISGSQWGFGIDPQWVPALAYDVVHGLKSAGLVGGEHDSVMSYAFGYGQAFRDDDSSWIDAIHDHVGEELD